MARESISKIAYKTLQQSKSIAGFAHKQISSRLMNFILPDSKLENFDINKDLLMQSSSLKLSIEFWICIRRSLSISKFSSFESGSIKFINLELICL